MSRKEYWSTISSNKIDKPSLQATVMRPNHKDLGKFGLGLRSDLYYDRNLLLDPLTGKEKPRM